MLVSVMRLLESDVFAPLVEACGQDRVAVRVGLEQIVISPRAASRSRNLAFQFLSAASSEACLVPFRKLRVRRPLAWSHKGGGRCLSADLSSRAELATF